MIVEEKDVEGEPTTPPQEESEITPPATEEETPPADGDGTGSGDTPPVAEEKAEPEEPGGKRAKKRIHELLTERHTLRTRIQELETTPAPAPTSPGPQGNKPQKPNPKTFTNEFGEIDWDKYNIAEEQYGETLLNWHDTQKEFHRTRENMARVEEEMKKEFTGKAAPVAEKYKDYYEVVGEYQPLIPVRDFLMDSEAGPMLAYHLAKNPAINEQIETLARMSFYRMYRALQELEKKFSIPIGRNPATPPINPVSSDTGVSRKDPGKMTAEEYYHAKKAGQIS